jgi:hypothetical protein
MRNSAPGGKAVTALTLYLLAMLLGLLAWQRVRPHDGGQGGAA